MALSLHPGWQLDFLLSPQAAAAQHDGAVNLCISWCLSGGLGEEGFRGKGMEHVPAAEAPVCIDGTEHFLLVCRSLNAARGWQPGIPAPTHCDRRRQPVPLFALDEHVINGNGRKWGPHQYSNSLYSLCHSPGWLSLLQISFCKPLLDFSKKTDLFATHTNPFHVVPGFFQSCVCIHLFRLDLARSKEIGVLVHRKGQISKCLLFAAQKDARCRSQSPFPVPPDSCMSSGEAVLLWPPLSETPDKACGTEVENLTSPRVAGMENNTPPSQA